MHARDWRRRLRLFSGVDAYEASLELGADGAKKGRKLGNETWFAARHLQIHAFPSFQLNKHSNWAEIKVGVRVAPSPFDTCHSCLANEALKTGRHAGQCCSSIQSDQIECIGYSYLGEDALESAQEYAKDSKKKATKKVKEAAEETSETTHKAKRKATEL